ncbi:MAG: hypothetical protein WCJ35_08310 [Planctomycetota bacterium]
MCTSLRPTRRTWIPVFFALLVAIVSCPVSAQPSPDAPPVTYEVQIDGESFQVEGSQRPIKVESKRKKGTTYTLALRVAMTQPLRLNSVQMEYGMWAKVTDNKRKELRIAQIDHELGFSFTIMDLGNVLDAEQQDKLLKTLAEDAVKRFTDRKATDLKPTIPKVQKFGPSDGRWLKINYNDSEAVARTCMIFVLSGKKYTVSAVAEFRDQDKEDVGSWVMSALGSIRPLE